MSLNAGIKLGRYEVRAKLGEGHGRSVSCLRPEDWPRSAQVIDHRSDIFSFGSILYEMITGRRAFQQENDGRDDVSQSQGRAKGSKRIKSEC